MKMQIQLGFATMCGVLDWGTQLCCIQSNVCHCLLPTKAQANADMAQDWWEKNSNSSTGRLLTGKFVITCILERSVYLFKRSKYEDLVGKKITPPPVLTLTFF